MSTTDDARTSGVQVEIEKDGSACVVRLLGELDLTGIAEVNEALADAETSDAETVLLDIDRLEFIDSSGLAALLEASRRDAESGRLRITRGTGHVAEMLRITGLDRTLPLA